MSQSWSAALVFFGAGIGGVCRYLIHSAIARKWPDFPWGTLAVNVVGSLCIGLLIGQAVGREAESRPLELFLGVGLLGGFTTFSTFSADAIKLLQAGAIAPFLGYALGSVALSISSCAIGIALSR